MMHAFVKICAKNRHSCTAVQRSLSVCVRGVCARVFVALGNGLDRKKAEEDGVSEAVCALLTMHA